MKLFRLLAPPALMCSLALAGCATIPNPVKQSYVYGAEAGYAATAQQLAIVYGSLPYCARGTTTSATSYCQDPKIEVQIAAANAKVTTARRALESFVRNPANYPGLTYAQLLTTFGDAVTTLQQIEAQNGVH